MISQMSDEVIKQAIHDPTKIYKSPGEVLADKRLTPKDKNKILESWEHDAKALLQAEGENMTDGSDTKDATQSLRRIQQAQKEIKT